MKFNNHSHTILIIYLESKNIVSIKNIIIDSFIYNICKKVVQEKNEKIKSEIL